MKRPFWVLLVLFSLIYFLIKLFTYYVSSLQVLEFSFICIFTGLFPAYFFRKILLITSFFDWIVYAGSLGIILIPYLFLFWGWLGVNQIFVHSILVLYGVAFGGFISLIIYSGDEVEDMIRFGRVKKIDAISYVLIFFVTLLLTILCFSNVFVAWDAFTFWGLDAKYIFVYDKLRDSTLDVFRDFRYTSYYPIIYSIIYDIYGNVVEQRASWVNIFINLLAMLLVYKRGNNLDALLKFILVTGLIVISYAAIDAVQLLSIYADAMIAFNLLLFILVLIVGSDGDSYSYEDYIKRMLLLLLISTSFYFIKSPLLVITLLLLITWSVYDLLYLKDNYKHLIIRLDFWLVLVSVLVLYCMRQNYFTNVLEIGGNTPISDMVNFSIPSIRSLVSYSSILFKWLFVNSPYIFTLWVLGMISLLFVARQNRTAAYLAIYFISLTSFMIFVGGYIWNQTPLESRSLIRYSAIVMYLLPFLFSQLSFKIPRHLSMFLIITSASILLICFGKIANAIIVFFNNPFPATGSYSVYLKNYSRVARKAKSIAGDDTKILIVDDIQGDPYLSNKLIPAIFVRYFMMENSVGGQYQSLHVDQLQEYAELFDADYILLLYYDGVFSNCNNFFLKNHNYLIRVGTTPFWKSSSCEHRTKIYDLGD